MSHYVPFCLCFAYLPAKNCDIFNLTRFINKSCNSQGKCLTETFGAPHYFPLFGRNRTRNHNLALLHCIRRRTQTSKSMSKIRIRISSRTGYLSQNTNPSVSILPATKSTNPPVISASLPERYLRASATVPSPISNAPAMAIRPAAMRHGATPRRLARRLAEFLNHLEAK
jgi:hypothetical protein